MGYEMAKVVCKCLGNLNTVEAGRLASCMIKESYNGVTSHLSLARFCIIVSMEVGCYTGHVYQGLSDEEGLMHIGKEVVVLVRAFGNMACATANDHWC
eukprot:c19099_g1_i1 orf=661-954(+)